MSAAATAATPAARAAVRPISIIERVTTELRKLVDYRGGRILLVVTVLLQAAIALGVTLSDPAGERSVAGTAAATMLVLFYVLPILGIMMAADEWRQKTVMVTYVQDSNRTGVFVAKVIAAFLLGIILLVVGALICGIVSLVLGGSTAGIGELVSGLGAPIAGVAVAVLVGAGLGGALLSLAIGLVLFLVVVPLLPQLLQSFEATQAVAPYVDLSTLLNGLLAGLWPQDWTTAGVALAVWGAVPLAIAIWRNATKDIS